MTITTETVKKRIEEATNLEYTLIGEYTGAHVKVRIKHLSCGIEREVRLSHFLDGRRCQVCKPPRKSNIEFLKEVYDLVGEEYTFLEEYKNSTTHLKVIHNKCKQVYLVKPSNFLSGKRCPFCAKNMPYTTDTFKEKIFELVGDEYELVSEYLNSKTKVDLIHKVCGNKIDILPASFVSGNRCRYCMGGVVNKTPESYRQEVFKISNGEYIVLGDYVNATTKILFKHNICGNEYLTAPSYFNSGNRCPYCALTRPLNTSIYKQRVRNMYQEEYEVLGEYINNSTKIHMRHNKCGYKYYTMPSDFMSGKRCPKCYKNWKKTTEQFANEVFNIYGDEYQVAGDYKGGNEKIDILHKKCGNTFSPTPSNILRKVSGCPFCASSKGENLIQEYLSDKNFIVKREYTFSDCKHVNRLKFDFALFKNNKLLCLIEFDGEQHFRAIDFWGGEQGFKINQKRDNIKNSYCKKNDIPLIRIPYWEIDNIDFILDKKLKKIEEREYECSSSGSN